MIGSFRHRGLKQLFETGQSSKVRFDLHERCRRRLDALDQAKVPGDVNLPGFDFHPLRGRPKRYSVHVNGPWCITFEWEEDQPVRVDLEQYHEEEDMPEYAVRRPLKRCPTHPGAILREDILPALRLSVADAAEKMHISRQTLHRILAERAAVTPDMALRLGKFCGNGPALWLGMQQAYDLWQAEERLRAEIKSIETARAA